MIDRLRAALQFLADHPVRLFAILFAINAIGVPYTGIVHDAKLYSAQALNAYDQRFANDLFFHYGSQAKFTLFPELLAPFCGKFGPRIPFWVGYMLATATILAGIQRFLLALIGRTPVAVLGLILISCQLLPLGGLGIFNIIEPFFTPRPFAIALTFFALERILVNRVDQAFLILLPASVIHPLMAAPGWLMWGLWIGWGRPGRSAGFATIGLIAGIIGAVAVLTFQRLGFQILGQMEPEWREAVLRLNRYADPVNWLIGDWLRLAQAALFTLGMISVWGSDFRKRLFLLFILLIGLAGIFVAVYAARAEYSLLLQGQAYRWVLFLELLRFPFGVALLIHNWNLGTKNRKLLAIGIALLLSGIQLTEPSAWYILATAWAAGVILLRGLRSEPRNPDWLIPTLAMAVGVVAIAWTAFLVIVLYRAKALIEWDYSYDLTDRISVWANVPGPATRLLAVFGIGFLLWSVIKQRSCVSVGVPLTLALVTHFCVFTIGETEWAGREFDRNHANKQFVREYVKNENTAQRPSVYWPTGRLELIWISLECPCYFDTFQLSGNYFNRGNAMEGQRRALIVRAFEIEHARQSKSTFWKRELADPHNVFDAGIDLPPPSRTDFERLVHEPAVDLIVLPHEFPGYVATNGQIFLYDARKLRSR